MMKIWVRFRGLVLSENSKAETKQKKSFFLVHTKALALLRIVLGLIFVLDVFHRGLNFEAFHSYEGIVPVATHKELLTNPFHWSLLFPFSSDWLVALHLLLQFVFGILLVLGIRTRLVMVICWVLLLSMQNRNIAILNSGDNLLRLLFFWMMFLPLDHHYCWKGRKNRGFYLSNLATMAIQLQVCYVYWLSIVFKWHEAWWFGDAMERAMSMDQRLTFLGKYLSDFDSLMPLFSGITFFGEALVPFLCFFWWLRPGSRDFVKARLICIVFFWAFHFGIFLTMKVGFFPLISMASWIVFLPAAIGERRVSKKEAPAYSLPILCVAFMLALAWNLAGTHPILKFKHWPNLLNPAVQVLRLEQRWNMFSPRPSGDMRWLLVREYSESDGWSVRIGQEDRVSGRVEIRWDLQARRNLSSHWIKYIESLGAPKGEDLSRPFLRYLCNNPVSSKKVMEVEVALRFLRFEDRESENQWEKVRKKTLGRLRCDSFVEQD